MGTLGETTLSKGVPAREASADFFQSSHRSLWSFSEFFMQRLYCSIKAVACSRGSWAAYLPQDKAKLVFCFSSRSLAIDLGVELI